MSMLKGKTGFVIPKNKFSGSLVPIFKPGNKSGINDGTASEDSGNNVQRKTKWGNDLTQDASVKRGRALAYQTRVDQITRQLKLGSLSGESDTEFRTGLTDYEKLQSLELERREVIGEILKLNPSYKAPSDYQPVMREAIVSIPVKEHPGFNFVGLVYGADGDTHKRLEKETGTKIHVYGTKSDAKEKETGTKIEVYGSKSDAAEKVEIKASDSNDVLSSYDEVYVRILADTYEKVDAAANLIELLFSSISGKSAASEVSAAVSGENVQVPSEGQEMVIAPSVSTSFASQTQPVIGSILTSSQGSFPPYQGVWFPAGQSNMPSGPSPVPSSAAFTFNPSPMHQVFGLGPPTAYGFGSSSQTIAVGPPRAQSPVQAMHAPPYPVGQAGSPMNHSAPSSLMGHRPTSGGSPMAPLAHRPLIPPASSPGSVVSQSVASVPAAPSGPLNTPQAFPSSQVGPTLATPFLPPQIRSSSIMPLQSFAPPNLSTNNVSRPPQTHVPPSASHMSQSGMPIPTVGTLNSPSFTPLKPMGSAAPRPPLPGSGDFTFQPRRSQGPPQSVPGPGVVFASQRPQGQLPPQPQAASFRPILQNRMPQHVSQNFPRQQISNPMGPPRGQFGQHPNPQMGLGPRNLGPVPQMPNAAGPFAPRLGHSAQHQQSYPASPLGRPGGLFVPNQHSSPSGRPQVYDPFSPPVSAQGSSSLISRKQESDPEYEDLMASVGVK